MSPILAVLFRQIKLRLFLLLHCLKRVFCCFRSKTKQDDDEDVDELMVGNSFVVVQGGAMLDSALANAASANSTLGQTVAVGQVTAGLPGALATGQLANDRLMWASESSDMFYNSNSNNNKGASAFSYSNYSLVNQQQQPQFSPDNIGSRISIGPNRTFSNAATRGAAPSQQRNTTELEPEQDFFQDMAPQFRKPKTVYVAKEEEVRQEDISRKFQIDDRKAIELDDSKFKPFGAMDEINSTSSAAAAAYQVGAAEESSWENMAAEEDAWGDLDQTLVAVRREAREQRLRENQQQRKLRQQQSAPRKMV